MKVKKYTASSMSEAMKQIREELGADAVILNSKPLFSGGFLGLFKKRSIEVIAAADPDSSSLQARKQKERKQPAVPKADNSMAAKPLTPQPIQPQPDVVKELADLKSLILKMQSKDSQKNFPEPLKEIWDTLYGQEVDEAILAEIMEKLMLRWQEAGGGIPEEMLNQYSKEALLDKMPSGAFDASNFEKKYITIVGPTGVGKTTTLAKIAAECILKQNKKVAFITTDTYRIAAIDQLKTYAKILNVPIEVAYNLEDFRKAAERFSHYDAVFIDTAGRNFRNPQYVSDLKDIIDFSYDTESYLVLSLTSKQKDMEDIYKQFSAIPIKQLIFTKADETATYGAMLNFLIHQQVGAAYITNGQNVPDDIEKATPENIIETVFGEKKYEGSS
ncbi:flagellar biosynthesis protein FlhF [Bacillus sp. OV322]|uniref:flagellar biosynthesis protein FlhF n=1 Tax=Bacillus sp. OV322 TaxID=1882764 RepID=UPI0008E01F5D|nr:flagellar biosynthesis protein FlhF [Bacillus sp. OV322]SFC07537.1 flagellar biosynthesis protein FlhF [Bacillus sp. OV322]